MGSGNIAAEEKRMEKAGTGTICSRTGGGGACPRFLKRNRVRLFFFLLCLALTLASCQTPRSAGVSADEEVPIFAAAEKTLTLLNEREDYRAVWDSISNKSKDGIINDVMRACGSLKLRCDSTALRADFEKGGPDAVIYWQNFLAAFDPNSILVDSKWRLGAAGPAQADIIIRHRDSDREAVLKIVKEDGVWKLGLEESFGVRKWMQR